MASKGEAWKPSDLYHLAKEDTAADVRATFNRQFIGGGGGGGGGLAWVVYRAFGRQMKIAGLCKLAGDLFGFVGPLALAALLHNLSEPESAPPSLGPQLHAVLISLAMFVSSVLQTVCLHQHHHLVIREGMHVRSAVITGVFDKSLRLACSEGDVGQIVNLQSVDSHKLMEVMYFFHYIWAAPLQILIAIALLWVFMGPASLAGLAVMILIIPLQLRLNKKIGSLAKRTLAATDARIGAVNELLGGIRQVKICAWEDIMLERVHTKRDAELRAMRASALLRALNDLLLQSGPVIVAFTAFATYSYSHDTPITAEIAFTALALFAIFRLPLMILASIIFRLIEGRASFRRLHSFLTRGELAVAPHEDGAGGIELGDSKTASVRGAAVRLHGSFELPFEQSEEEEDEKKPTPATVLRDLDLAIAPGTLTVIVGKIGSGKTLLLKAALGELRCCDGGFGATVDGSTAFASQVPWVQNQTFRENICFGLPFDEAAFKSVLSACCLDPDVATLPGGIETEIGERGVTLSGGQKARVALARAMYARRDVYIFDDPLSALDADVSTKVLENCILNHPLMPRESVTRILVTHRLHCAAEADRVIVVDKLRVIETGSFRDLTSKPGGHFASIFEEYEKSQEEVDENEEREDAAGANDRKGHLETTRQMSEEEASDEIDPSLVNGTLVEEEAREIGTVRFAVYLDYLRTGCQTCGAAVGIAVVLLFAQVLTNGADLWLTVWTTADDTERRLGHYIGVYGGLACALIVSLFLRDCIGAILGLRAARKLHDDMIDNLVHAPLSFYDCTPLGRILNRFSADTNTIDTRLQTTFLKLVTMMLGMLGIFAVQCFVSPLLLLPLMPIVVLYYFITAYYRETSRELQRLDNVSKSPIFALLSEVLDGLETIRAFGFVERFKERNDSAVDGNNRAFWLLNLINRWLGVRLELLGALILLGVTLLVCANRDTVNLGLAGLVVGYSLTVTNQLNWVVRNAIDTENQLTAVERMAEYRSIRPEAGRSIAEIPNWPNSGAIEFAAVSARYRPALPLVLKSVSFTVNSGEKIGICGRTGSGKSTLIRLMCRLIEAEQVSGAIFIDNVNTRDVSPRQLRSCLTVVPQDPHLPSGSVRNSMDPLNQFSDAELLSVLEGVGTGTFLSDLGGLDAQITEGGGNISVGQRQLLCLASALLRKTRILLLDEATSSVDFETDAAIQRLLRSPLFAAVSVLTIAHRIDTILHTSDRVLVLDAGTVAEFAPPGQLIEDKNSHFAKLVRAAKEGGGEKKVGEIKPALI